MRTIQDFARELSVKLDKYLAIGLTPKDIEWVIIDAMKAEMKARKSNTEAVK